jgi:hypothetical protein
MQEDFSHNPDRSDTLAHVTMFARIVVIVKRETHLASPLLMITALEVLRCVLRSN